MTITEAIVLGVLQGLTEFLPVSSSGHLVLMQHFLEMKEPQVFFDVMLHVGTLGAVVVVYRQSIWALTQTGISAFASASFYRHSIRTINDNRDLKLVWFILIGSIPTGLIAILFKDQFKALFAKPEIVAAMLIVTGLLLHLPRLRREKQHGNLSLRAWHTPLIGIAQGLAITPGISRSGSTISLCLMLGISPQIAAQYSFLLAIPAILGALLLEIGGVLKDVAEVTLVPTLIGTLTAFVAGYIALRVLLTTLNRGKFSLFSYYCFAVGGTVLIRMVW
jgi:undecaprenyl-diphosphatase